MPATPDIKPVNVKTIILWRTTLIPANLAASALCPMARVLLPNGVRCNSRPKIIPKIIIIGRVFGINVVPNVSKPKLVQNSGNSFTVFSPKIPLAIPRYNARVPMVTASEPSPSLVTKKPFKNPHTVPTARQIIIASQIGAPLA